MSHVRTLHFETLEAKKLPSTVHAATADAAAKVASAPLVLDGTLSVDAGSETTSTNADGGPTTQYVVAGRLGAVGKVRGVWSESFDAYGDYLGPDTIQLRSPEGTFVIAFNNANTGRALADKQGTVYYQDAQRLYHGTRAYKGASETGSIELIENAAQTQVEALQVHTRGS